MMMKSKRRADADIGPVAAQVAIGEMVAVGDRGLMLHPGIGNFDQLVAVLRERVVTEVVAEDLKHLPGLRELTFRLLLVCG